MLFEQDDEENPVVTAMSFFPKEADPIWSKYSTHAVVHTMAVSYTHLTLPTILLV